MLELKEFRENIYQNYGVRECPHYGEDGVILKIFEEIGVSENPHCIEFGELRVLGTTTRSYRIFYKAKSLYFSFSYDFRSFYLNILDVFKIVLKTTSLTYFKFLFNFPFKEFITPSNCEEIFEKNNVIKNDLDLITVDLDSGDYYVIEKILKLEYCPKVFIVEYNPSYGISRDCSFPNDIDFTPENSRIYGASYKAMNRLLNQHGYTLCFVSGFCNLFYIRDEYSDKFKVPNIHDEFTDTREKIEKYLIDHCQDGFIPSWMDAPELTAGDFKLLDDFESKNNS